MNCLRCKKETENEDFCDACCDDGWFQCENCGEISDNPDRGKCGEYLCSECFDSLFCICDDCGRIEDRDEIASVNNSVICRRCYDRHYFYCEHCGYSYHNDDYGSDGLCDNCYDEQGSDDDNNNDKRRIVSIPATPEEIHEMATMLISGIPVRRKYTISVNREDYGLEAVVKDSEPIDVPFYLYGLKDRPEYQLAFSTDVYKLLKPLAIVADSGLFLPSPIGWITAIQINNPGKYTLGICKSLREHTGWIVGLIKALAETKGCREMAKAA